ncbi:hypothetical protein DE146DRAFT_395756 [Phaeosphaeria sp. MPI-PUGE-AT-0046c]|nr:hypothetical protein DE146DRAFT_395756 [Phaeosphaeria sp. MPI-PUGE-AT-0046c]
MNRQETTEQKLSKFKSQGSISHPDPDPNPEPPAAPPIIILSKTGKAHAAPQSQPQQSTSLLSQESPLIPRYNLRTRKETRPIARGDDPEPPDPFPAAPPVIILSNKRPASASPPRSPPSIKTTPTVAPSTSSNPNSAISASPTTQTAPSSLVPTPTADHTNTTLATSYFAHPVNPDATATYNKQNMGSKGSKLAPSGGKLQPSQDKQDKAEMKEPTNYYTHRSKSMRRKAGKTGATSGAGGSGGGAGGGAGGAV